MRRVACLILLVVGLAGCATIPDGAYFPDRSPRTTAVANSLYRAAQAAGDNPARYSFALIKTQQISAFSSGADDAVFFFSDRLAREVAHEVLGHAGQRRALSIGITGTFTVLGLFVPGLSVVDWVVNPLVVRAFSRDQEISADVRAIEILRSMGHEMPRRTLANALREVEVINGVAPTGLLATFPPLVDRLAAIGPVEVAAEVAQQK